MHEYYSAQRAHLIVSGLLRLMGDHSQIAFRFDVRSLNAVWTPIDALNHTVNTGIFSAATPSVLAASLTQATHTITKYLRWSRN
jgi:hypothetical protein